MDQQQFCSGREKKSLAEAIGQMADSKGMILTFWLRIGLYVITSMIMGSKLTNLHEMLES